jgi:hypothetical protein
MKILSLKWVLIFLLLIFVCVYGVASASDIQGIYLMDGLSHRVVHINKIEEGIYRVEEPGGSWPWDGCAILDGNLLFGIAKFLNNKGSMMLRGSLRSGGRISISYVFMTDSNGNFLSKIGPGRGRVDRHNWYKK